MVHDRELIDQLSDATTIKFDGEVYRVTPTGADPLAASQSGGRWGAPKHESGYPVLYTSETQEGAVAEVASYYILLDPPPSKPVELHALSISLASAVTLVQADLVTLGVDPERYGERDYERTQEIGAVINFLGLDGLICPAARWECNNVTIFSANAAAENLAHISTEPIDWKTWAKSLGILED